MSIILDDLDKKILHYLSNGVYSYEDLASKLSVTRATIYRRVEKLEENHAILSKIGAIPNYVRLNIAVIFMGINPELDEIEGLLNDLCSVPYVKCLWETFGEFQVVAALFCEKGTEGETVSKFNKIVGDRSKRTQPIAIGFDWKKMDLSPYPL